LKPVISVALSQRNKDLTKIFETSYQRSVEPMFVLCDNIF